MSWSWSGSGNTNGMLTWIAAQSSGFITPMAVVTTEPQSPPCATQRVYPRRRISVIQAPAIRGMPQPVSVAFGEAVTRERGGDYVEGVLGLAAVGGRVGQGSDDLHEFD